MILTSTLAKDKGLRSVINKMVIQVGAKLGMVPWSIDSIPLNDQPTMLVGIDVSSGSSAKGKSVIGMTASIDPQFCQYWSQCEFAQDESSLQEFIYKNFLAAI